jgi:hypothetical protein
LKQGDAAGSTVSSENMFREFDAGRFDKSSYLLSVMVCIIALSK